MKCVKGFQSEISGMYSLSRRMLRCGLGTNTENEFLFVRILNKISTHAVGIKEKRDTFLKEYDPYMAIEIK